jgi:hypothetical protein
MVTDAYEMAGFLFPQSRDLDELNKVLTGIR